MHSTLTQTWFYDVFPGTSRVEFLNSYSDFVSSKRYLLFLVFLCLCVPFFVLEILLIPEISSLTLQARKLYKKIGESSRNKNKGNTNIENNQFIRV